MLHKAKWLLIVVVLLAIVGCTPGGSEPGVTPTDEAAEQAAPDALPAAEQALADYLGVDPESLALEKIEDAEWSDGCLGLGGPAESCLAAITPGYAITFAVGGESYTVRTDLEGNQARVEGAMVEAPEGDELPPAVEAARDALAGELGVDLSTIELVSFEQQEWSDSCLGLGGPAEICAAVITPGWRVMLMVEGEAYEVRTDFNGEQVRIADESAGEPAGEIPGPELDGAAVFFQRSGGFTGELLTVRIYTDGTIERAMGEPSPDLPVETAVVDPAVVETLTDKLAEIGYFDLERSYLPEDTCCDRYLYLISVQGEENAQTVEALEATEAAPANLWQSVALIEAVINEAFGS
ncbi:MAG: hypothetical protein IT327_07295 [Anaerolineae bacterium]|nr:hypothetical protein [Anaerolineae bacterium]